MSDSPHPPTPPFDDDAATAGDAHRNAWPGGGRGRRALSALRRSEPGTVARFSQPVRQILLMLVVLGLVGLGGTLAYGRIWTIFAANPWLNGTILAVFALGVLTCFWQAVQLVASVSWIERFATRRVTALKNGIAPRTEGDGDTPPPLLAPLAALLGSTGPTAGLISTSAARSIQDSVATRIDEARDVTRYLSQLLIFLGLLGTFYGLATTIPGVVETIRALAPRDGETGVEMFGELMTGLESQLGGMATAFSSSLLGLAGSLVVGLLELFAGHGQNRFYRELEEWMTGFTRVGLAGPDGDGASLDHAAMAHFLDQIAQQTVVLSEFYAERDTLHEQDRLAADARSRTMAASVERLAEHVLSDGKAAIERASHLSHALGRIAEAQERLMARADDAAAAPQRPEGDPAARVGLRAVEGALHRLADGQEQLIALTEAAAAARAPDAGDTEARLHLRSIDGALRRMAEEQGAGLADVAVDLRADLATLTRAVRALGEPLPPGDGGGR